MLQASLLVSSVILVASELWGPKSFDNVDSKCFMYLFMNRELSALSLSISYDLK